MGGVLAIFSNLGGLYFPLMSKPAQRGLFCACNFYALESCLLLGYFVLNGARCGHIMSRVVAGVLLLAFAGLVFADTITLRWAPPTDRENGTPITGTLRYEIWKDNALVWDGEETSYSAEVGQGAHSFQVYAIEDGLRSMPVSTTIEIRRFPPNPPVLQ